MKLFSAIKNTKSSMYDLNKYIRTAPGISTMYEVDLSGFADFTALNKKWDSKLNFKYLNKSNGGDLPHMFYIFYVSQSDDKGLYFGPPSIYGKGKYQATFYYYVKSNSMFPSTLDTIIEARDSIPVIEAYYKEVQTIINKLYSSGYKLGQRNDVNVFLDDGESSIYDFRALNKKWESKFSDLKKEKLLHHYKNDDKMFFVFSVINTTLRDDYFDDVKEVEGYTFPILGKLEPRWHSEFRLSREYSEEVLSQSKATHYVNEIREDIKLLKDHYSDIMKYYQEVWDIVKKSV